MPKSVDWDDHIGRRLRLRDLHVFFTVVQLGSMAKAAAKLRVTQPAVSQVIADLEHAVGFKLLNRSPRGVEATVYGTALLKGGAAAFDDLEQSLKEIEFLADPTVGEVRIGCPETVSAILSPVIGQLARRHPGVVLRVDEVVAPTLDVPQLRDRTLDMALLRLAPTRHPLADDLNVEILLIDGADVVVGQSSRWARRRKLDLADLAVDPWILSPEYTHNSKVVLEAFRSRGLEPPAIQVVTFSVALRSNLLATGKYVTVFPHSMMRLSADRMALKVLPVKLPHLDWPLAMVTLKNRMLNPVVELFMQQVRESMKTLVK